MEEVYLPVKFQEVMCHLMFVPAYKFRESLYSDHYHLYSNDAETKRLLPIESFWVDYLWDSKEWVHSHTVSSDFIVIVIEALKKLHCGRYDKDLGWNDQLHRLTL
jgi:hypothetical protein